MHFYTMAGGLVSPSCFLAPGYMNQVTMLAVEEANRDLDGLSSNFLVHLRSML